MYTELNYEGKTYPKNKTFNTPYDEYKSHQGKPFEIIKFVCIQDNAPIFLIEVETGQRIEALPEEIFEGFGTW
jgi:hypothetical protein